MGAVQIVLTLTEAGHVWLSKDGGLTWKDQSEAGLVRGCPRVCLGHGLGARPGQQVQAKT